MIAAAQVPAVTPTPNPAAPPGVEPTPPPTAPPGTNVPAQTPSPTPGEPAEPNFPQVQPRPLPALPNLTRLGVSGNTVPLSLNEAVRRALQNNNDIEVARDDVRLAETTLRSLQGVYDPVFTMTPTYDKRISPQTSIFSGATSAGTTSVATITLSPSITKQFEPSGAVYTVTFANSHTNTSATSSTLNPFYSSNLSFSLTQPLMRNMRIDRNRHAIRVQKVRLEQSDADFRLRTIAVISRVQSAYWDLVFALRDQQIQLDNLNLSRENLRQIEAQIAAGAKAPLDRAEVLTEIANRQSTLLAATQTVSIAENNLKQLILKDPISPDWSAQLTPSDTPQVDTTPVNLDDAISEARKNRPELQRLRLQRNINDIDIAYFKNQTKPQVDVFSTFAFTGLAGGKQCPPSAVLPNGTCSIQTPSNLIGGYGQDLSNVFGLKTRNITVGVAISIPLKNTTAKANLAGAQIQREQLEASTRSTSQSVEVDVRNAAQAVETARQRVFTAREARANAEVQLEGEQRLYAVGRSTTFLLFQRQNALANARDAELRAETDYNKAVSNLQQATSTTLRANNVVVETHTTQ